MKPVTQGIKISLWFVVNNVFSFLVFRHNYVNMTPDFFFLFFLTISGDIAFETRPPRGYASATRQHHRGEGSAASRHQ